MLYAVDSSDCCLYVSHSFSVLEVLFAFFDRHFLAADESCYFLIQKRLRKRSMLMFHFFLIVVFLTTHHAIIPCSRDQTHLIHCPASYPASQVTT